MAKTSRPATLESFGSTAPVMGIPPVPVPVPAPAPAPAPVQAAPEPVEQKTSVRVRTKGAFPINCAAVGVMVFPGTVVTLPAHDKVMRQIQLGTLIEV